ncbi:GNAT family N-acetyltransferase [Shewanella sp. GXUN23E]|uniref:GNAT family N-acetyltransferase n=1 Tax=Shewanella sp. GXUN23E TaxID=3422498 RepID=UPI003D7ECF16
MTFTLDDLTHPQVLALLQEHLQEMHASSPPEAVHALDVSQLKQPDIHFYSLWLQGEQGEPVLAACGALKRLDGCLGELKSMRSSKACRGLGYGRAMLNFLIQQAHDAGLSALYLETGTAAYFDAARALYASAGFRSCGPFGDYPEHELSCFMKLSLHQNISA